MSETYKRYCFNVRAQQPDEPFDSFVSDLRGLAKSCSFCNCLKDSLIRDRIVMEIESKELRKQLLSIKKLSLEVCIDTCRATEATVSRMSAMQASPVDVPAEIHRVERRKYRKPSSTSSSSSRTPAYSAQRMRECDFCGNTHEMLKSECPAYRKFCDNCGRKNHFAKKCRQRQLNMVEKLSDSDSELELIDVLSSVSARDSRVYAELQLCEQPVQFLIDCGATENVLSLSHAGESGIYPTTKRLQMWNKTVLKPLGEAKVPIYNPVSKKKYLCKFLIVPDKEGCLPLLGNKVSQKMELITINIDKFKQVDMVNHEVVWGLYSESKS